MRRRFRWDKKYLNWGITAFCVVAAAILFYMALRFLPNIGSGAKKFLTILSPFVWGLGITYLLSPLMKILDKFLKGKKAGGSFRLRRSAAVLVSEIILLIVITALILLIIPQLYSSIETIVTNSPEYISKITSWVEVVLKDNPELEKYASDAISVLNTDLIELLKTKIMPSLGNIVSNLTTGVYAVLKSVYNLIIGIIVSVYLLSNIEGVIAGTRRILYSIFSIETAEKIRTSVRFIDKTFMGFIKGKLLDSLIIGFLCYIVCALLRMPYNLLVSVIVCVTNIIPFFGPFIGAIPSALIILLVDPLKCLIFVIFIIILQQLDGNVIGPKILGSSIGIDGFWVMFSIILGAGLFGFWGMLLGVPVFVVIYTGVDRLIERKLQRTDLPVSASSYRNLDHIDAATREVFTKPIPAEISVPEKKALPKKTASSKKNGKSGKKNRQEELPPEKEPEQSIELPPAKEPEQSSSPAPAPAQS